jgi:hypothetical protein
MVEPDCHNQARLIRATIIITNLSERGVGVLDLAPILIELVSDPDVDFGIQPIDLALAHGFENLAPHLLAPYS